MKPHQRNAEARLLLISSIIIVSAYVLASLGRYSSPPPNIIPFLGIIVLLFLAAHMAMRKYAPHANPTLLPLAGVLNGLGYVIIARLQEDLAGLQASWTFISVIAFITVLATKPAVNQYQRYKYSLLLLGVFLLILPLFPVIGREINGSRIWVSIGPMNFQPGEFAKIALALFFAGYLVERREILSITSSKIFGISIPEPRALGPLVFAWLISLVVMVMEKDLGSSLLFFILFVALLWVATQRNLYLLISTVLFTGGAFFAWNQFAHVHKRVDIWLHPFNDPSGDGFQLVQSSFALAEGGLTGTGLGLGNPERIPAVETDFIFSAIGEELGLLGTSSILIAFILVICSGFQIALNAQKPFEKLLAAGLTTLLGFQSFIIIAGVVRVLPLTGVTLPFVSYGGSSLLSNWVILAILLRISNETNQHAKNRVTT
ncbi:MAG: FtsW/RodA/SpoVE family cell cycle protein [Acidimicrobiales bacterium]|jgi:peptidoglycan glycosyltransferase|nr:FtsW/RodA/SpoVE family cell cycle protein [Acidimicrobiales bacterium]MDP6298632.1 FtsW/RodA/SpoVE family cell cycle protein [Acidimicrobiales bacterium]HJM27722.1 FtsW/RodA/SpoVE family cell cycle protein [Acidimicrobiales bacterium]HJM98456.1 FtsW/RodA/SpoVE family cell cycle protein [Acidimicrobiales bacterium]